MPLEDADHMDIQLHFKPGIRHAVDASRYFRSLADEAVDELLPGDQPRQVLMACTDAPNIPMRVWSRSPRLDSLICGLLPLLLDILDRTTALRTGARNDEAVKDFARLVNRPVAEGESIFLELLGPKQPFTAQEEVILVIMILEGEIYFISAPGVIHAEVAPQLYGLAIAGMGSYQYEKVEMAMVPR
ncbi:MAG TPA: hypothetical protein VGE21_00980 [Flavobacteriales bacterium]